jgi:methionyl-tRNA formyltransferase
MDHGPIVSQFKEEILDVDNNETLRARLFERSADFLVSLIPNYVSRKIKTREQNHEKASFTNLAQKENGFIDINDFKNPEKSDEIDRKIRAFTPWPGVWTKLPDGKRLKILKPKLAEVQLEGKNPVKWKQFESAYSEYARLF